MAATIIDGMAFAQGRWKYSDGEQLTLDAIWNAANNNSDYVLNFCNECKSEEKFHITHTDYFIAHRDVGVDAVPLWVCVECRKTYGATEVFDAVDAVVEQLDLRHTTINYSELAKEVFQNDNDD
jgi:hypothetical protein